MQRPAPDICDKLKQHEAALKEQYHITNGQLYFRKLKGGICNAPVLVYQMHGGVEVPIGVLKLEVENQAFVNARFAALDEMTERGFAYNPTIFRNNDGGYLTRLGDEYYSMIEYIQPDQVHQEESITLAEMLRLTARFHQHAKDVAYQPALDQSRYALHMQRQHIIDEVDNFQIGAEFFKSRVFQRVRELYQFYATPYAIEMFEKLHKQFIHGDNHQSNLVYRNNEAFYIDLDARRYDLRLYDLCSIIRHGSPRINQEYVELAAAGKLFEMIHQHYGELTADERNSFHLILAFSYIEFFSWALNRIKRNTASGEFEAAQHLLSLVIEKSGDVLQLLDKELIDSIQIQHAVSGKRAKFAVLFPGEEAAEICGNAISASAKCT